MKKYLLTGEKVGLREISPDDINEKYCAWLNDLEVNKYMQSRYSPWNLDKMKQYLSNLDKYEYIFAICCLESDEHIGNIKLGPIDWINRKAEISILLGEKSSWGKGYGTEAVCLISQYALATLSLNKVTAGCYIDNIGSANIFLKNGFVFDPTDPRGGISVTSVKVDPKKIIAVVHTNRPNEVGKFSPVDEVTAKIGTNVANFLAGEIKAGRIPASFLPIQSGVGNIANAVLGSLGANPDIPPFEMYTEVIQDAVIDLMKEGNVKFASGCSLTVSGPLLDQVYADLDFFKERIVLRPQEISNNPEVARRLGLITINTALEADIFGNINSTHVLGNKMMNGVGGSCDFTRNAYISIFTTPSTAKGGKISAIVPMVSHLDQSEHSVKVLITEHGVADLRGKSPIQRAHEIIDNCVDPEYRDMLRRYLESAPKAHTPMNIYTCFDMHKAFMETGDMHNAKL